MMEYAISNQKINLSVPSSIATQYKFVNGLRNLGLCNVLPKSKSFKCYNPDDEVCP